MFRRCPLAVSFLAAVASVAFAAPITAAEMRWDFQLEGFFQGGKMPLSFYAWERDGAWQSVATSARVPGRLATKMSYNRNWHYADFSEVPLQDGKMEGSVTIHVAPDAWVPLDHQPYTIEMHISAKRDGDQLTGEWKLLKVNTDDPTADFGKSGTLTAKGRESRQPDLPEPVTFQLNLHAALVGGDPSYGVRCMVLDLGFEDGKLTSAAHAVLNRKNQVSNLTAFSPEKSELTATRDRLAGRIVVPAKTLDMDPATYIFEIDGRPLENYVLGTYAMTVKVQGQNDIHLKGGFEGKLRQGITRYEEEDDLPYYSEVKGFQPPKPGEHPRLLFRKSDVPALRKKAQTPEGQAIIARLRKQLNGGDGETMTKLFNDSKAAYARKSKETLPIGTYTIGHAAGYGLLYQLTGDKKYAELGKQCFEKALAGVRDRDDRYSFVEPGGALRAGPTLGWYAVGYDLCYDGWDPATREKFGKALYAYDQGKEKRDAKKTLDLENLCRGTMPPASNHFGMQVGGASLVVLAVEGEDFVDPEEIDRLKKIALNSMIRNLNEGFGDGGFFAEGDGTGSMSSQIVYLTAVEGWKHADGKDFVDTERPNARMTALKWMYQTLFDGGQTKVSPIRGAYGHNVWARDGVSGAGYFAIGIGAVRDDEAAAMKWIYERFMAERDAAAGGPFDTVSPYPHHTVCSFVNWPIGADAKDPNQVLPHCYQDSIYGFFCWRNRWQDRNDVIITALTNRTRGYMSARPDSGLKIHSGGVQESWGELKEAATEHWSTDANGKLSSLKLSNGACFAVDFTGESGADVMLVTNTKAKGQTVKVGEQNLTFFFPKTENPPKVEVKGDTAIVGKRQVRVEDGVIVF